MNNFKTVEIPECYRVLKIPPGSGWREVKGAYHARALEFHPDRNDGDPESEEQFKRVAEAFQILSQHFERGDRYYSFSAKSQEPFEDPFVRVEPFENIPDGVFPGGMNGIQDRLASFFRQVWDKLKSYERGLLVLDIETVITLDKEIALSGGKVKIRRGSEYREVRVPRGVDSQSVITIEGGGDRGILNTQRGDLRIRFQFKPGSSRQAEFHHVVEVARQDILRRKMFTLDTPEGLIRYSLPSNSKDGQQFTLYSQIDKRTGQRSRHVISIRVRPGI